MSRLTLGELSIESYSDGWKVGEEKVYQSGLNKGLRYLANVQYTATLQQALETALDRQLRESEAEGVDELLEEIREFRSGLMGFFALTVLEPRERR